MRKSLISETHTEWLGIVERQRVRVKQPSCVETAVPLKPPRAAASLHHPQRTQVELQGRGEKLVR